MYCVVLFAGCVVFILVWRKEKDVSDLGYSVSDSTCVFAECVNVALVYRYTVSASRKQTTFYEVCPTRWCNAFNKKLLCEQNSCMPSSYSYCTVPVLITKRYILIYTCKCISSYVFLYLSVVLSVFCVSVPPLQRLYKYR